MNGSTEVKTSSTKAVITFVQLILQIKVYLFNVLIRHVYYQSMKPCTPIRSLAKMICANRYVRIVLYIYFPSEWDGRQARKFHSEIRNIGSDILTNISMGSCKKNVSPLITHRIYVVLALTHRYVHYHIHRYIHMEANTYLFTTTHTSAHICCLI